MNYIKIGCIVACTLLNLYGMQGVRQIPFQNDNVLVYGFYKPTKKQITFFGIDVRTKELIPFSTYDTKWINKLVAPENLNIGVPVFNTTSPHAGWWIFFAQKICSNADGKKIVYTICARKPTQ